MSATVSITTTDCSRRLNINASITSINLGNGLLHKKRLVLRIFFLKNPEEELLIILLRELGI